jgi:hypothetical protein
MAIPTPDMVITTRRNKCEIISRPSMSQDEFDTQLIAVGRREYRLHVLQEVQHGLPLLDDAILDGWPARRPKADRPACAR